MDRRQTIVELEPSAHQNGEYFGGVAQRLVDLREPYPDEKLAVIERFLEAVWRRGPPAV